MANILDPGMKEGDKAMVRYISDCNPFTFGNGKSITAAISGSPYDAVRVDDSEPVFEGL